MTLMETRKKLDPNRLPDFEKIVVLLPDDSIFLNQLIQKQNKQKTFYKFK